MVRVGASSYSPTLLSFVVTIGTGSTDGWTKLFSLAGSRLPQQGTLDYAFAAWCTYGSALIPATASPVNAVMEVAVGNQTVPFQDSRVWTELNFGPTRSTLGQLPTLRGTPAFWVRGYTASGTNNRGAWVTTNDFAIWGRIFANGDPASALAGCAFIVSAYGIQAFSLSQFAATEKLWARHVPIPLIRNNTFTQGFRDHFQSPASWAAGAGDWLVLSSARFFPYSPTATPFYQTTYSADGSAGLQVGIFGRDSIQGGADPGQMGCSPRTTRSNVTGAYSLHQFGGWCVVQSPAPTAKLGCRGYDWNGVALNTSFLTEFEVLALRADTPSAGKGLGFFQFLQLSIPTTGRIYNDTGKVPTSYEPAEWTTAPRRFSDLVHCHCLVNELNDEPSYRMSLDSNTGPMSALADGLAAWSRGRTFPEGVHGHWGFNLPTFLPTTLVQWRFYATENLIELGGNQYRLAGDFCAASWHWENDPNLTPYPKPALPAPTAIVPGREAPNASALPTLPSMPDSAIETEAEVARHAFESDDLTFVTWPKFMVTRRTFRLQWSGLTTAQRDTLLAFFAAQAQRAFQWTPPSETIALALVVTNDPTTIDQGRGSHRVQLEATELVWTGP